mgnify:CR=1 FL=1
MIPDATLHTVKGADHSYTISKEHFDETDDIIGHNIKGYNDLLKNLKGAVATYKIDEFITLACHPYESISNPVWEKLARELLKKS